MSKYYIGIMSGTSMDAIDCVVVEFKEHSFKLIAAKSFPYPVEIKSSIQRIYQDNYVLSLETFGCLDYQLGEVYAGCVNQLLSDSKINKNDIIAVGCHGQTIFHYPGKEKIKFSIQLGGGHVTAEKTGLKIINDFRNRDMARGGQGAPLVPVFHDVFFRDSNESRVILNLGGIANVSCLHPIKPLIGFDTGPANTLIDQWIFKHHNKTYDSNGWWGKSGQVIPGLLDAMLKDVYFSQSVPKSTGLEYFNLSWIEQYLLDGEQAIDVQATLYALTVQTVIEAIIKSQPDTAMIYVCGGGACNTYLMSLFEKIGKEKNIGVRKISALGVDEHWIEAIAFGWLAKCYIKQTPVKLPSVSGSTLSSVLGVGY